MDKKAQITLFMLIGVVIVGGATLTFHAVQVKTKIELENKAEEVTRQLLKTTALEEYVTLCLKETAERGLFLLGNQGGVIYKSQNGTTIDYYGRGLPPGFLAVPWPVNRTDAAREVTTKEEVYVSYNLEKPSLSRFSLSHPPPPDYPYKGYLVPQEKEHLIGDHFGRIALKDLCDPNGPNRPGVVLYRPCETYGPLKGAQKSIQQELAGFIIYGLDECVEFEDFSKYVGYNVTRGEVKSNVTFTENSIVFDVEYPVTINLKGKSASKPIMFNTEIPVRLKKIHEYAYNFMEKAANDLFFNFTRDYKNITIGERSYWLPGFSYTIVKDACPQCSDYVGGKHDTIIKIQDDQSRLGGKPYSFQFIVRNRVPALEWIHKPSPLSGEYDLVAIENSTLVIEPVAYDTDQDELTYTYSGWREEYNEVYTFEDGVIKGEPYRTVLTENLWHKTKEYIETLKDSRQEVGHDDIGPHNFTVNATDTAGNSDYQIVRVLVNDLPVVDLRLDNMLAVDNRYGSIEDPFKLDASGTTAIYENGMVFKFEDPLEDYTEISSNSVVYLPEQDPDINTVHKFIFSELGEHKIFVSVSDNFIGAEGIGSDSKEVEVLECLPHRNKDHPFPYPFHKYMDKDYDGYADIENKVLVEEDINKYQAGHACCEGNPDYPKNSRILAADEKVCYRSKFFGCKEHVKEFDYGYDTGIISFPDGDDNDVYSVEYSRECDGERGNKCEGKEKIKAVLVQGCDNVCQTCEAGNPGCVDIDNACGGQECSSGEGGLFPGSEEVSPKLCSGKCSGGECKVATNCECNTDQCGATCDETSDYKEEKRGDDVFCSWGCDTESCEYTKRDEQCKDVCLTTSSSYTLGQECDSRTKIAGEKETYYCYYKPECTSKGCSFRDAIKIPAGGCGVCKKGEIEKGRCQDPYWVDEAGGRCYYGCMYNTREKSCEATERFKCPGSCVSEGFPLDEQKYERGSCDSSTAYKKRTTTSYCYYRPIICTEEDCIYESSEPVYPQNGGACYSCTKDGVKKADGRSGYESCPRAEDTGDRCKWGCKDNCDTKYDTWCPTWFIFDKPGCGNVDGTVFITPERALCGYKNSYLELNAKYVHELGKTEYCYYGYGDECPSYNVDEGCELRRERELRSGYCDQCTFNGKLNGEECHVPTEYPCSPSKKETIQSKTIFYYNAYITNCETNGVVRCGQEYTISYLYGLNGGSREVFDCDIPLGQTCREDFTRHLADIIIQCPDSGPYYFLKPNTYESCSGTTCNVGVCTDMKGGYDTSCNCNLQECERDCLSLKTTFGGLDHYGWHKNYKCQYNRCKCAITIPYWTTI